MITPPQIGRLPMLPPWFAAGSWSDEPLAEAGRIPSPSPMLTGIPRAALVALIPCQVDILLVNEGSLRPMASMEG